MVKVRDTDDFCDGFEDNLEQLEAIDLSKCKNVDDIVRAMSRCSFGARSVGEAAEILEEMIRDKECYKVLTISGALTVAKMQLIFIEMVDRGWVDAIISTGALIAHGLIEGIEMKHFKYKGKMNDKQLFEKGYDRVYDTLELEKNLLGASALVDEAFSKKEYDEEKFTSPEICRILGRHLVENEIGKRSILKSTYNNNIPLYIPALNDSELGLDLISLKYARKPNQERKRVNIIHDALSDVDDFAKRIVGQEKLGIFTIGGGVPRNWAQQVGPFLELKYNFQEKREAEYPRYYYGVRICPEPTHWGGLSGCSYSEGVSWGKFRPDGKFAEIYADATIVLPFLIKALMERFE